MILNIELLKCYHVSEMYRSLKCVLRVLTLQLMYSALVSGAPEYPFYHFEVMTTFVVCAFDLKLPIQATFGRILGNFTQIMGSNIKVTSKGTFTNHGGSNVTIILHPYQSYVFLRINCVDKRWHGKKKDTFGQLCIALKWPWPSYLQLGVYLCVHIQLRTVRWY